MIESAEFQEQFKYYDREVIQEIIDLFLGTYREQLKLLKTSIETLDLGQVTMQAHSLKGLAGTFQAPAAHRLASKLEETARNKGLESLIELYDLLDASIHEMAGDLKRIREELYP